MRRRLRLFFGVRVRLLLWYVVILALVLLLFSGAIYVTEQQALLSQVDSRVDARLRQLAGAYDARSGRLSAAPDAATAQGDEVVLLLTPAGQVAQIQAAGRLSAVKVPWDRVVQTLRAVAQSRSPAVVEQGLMLTVAAGATKQGLLPATTTMSALFRLSGMALTQQGRTPALLVVGIRSDVPRQMAALARTLETVAPLILLLCAGGGYWLANRALRPLRTITRTARQIGATDLSRRLNLQRRDELGQLGATFDQMLDRLEAAFERQRRFTADASHELRTPLAIVELEATRALARPRTPAEYRRAIAVMQQENGYMTRLVAGLLTLARADSGQAMVQCEEVDLAEVVLDVAERLVPLAEQNAMTVRIDPLPALLVWGDRVALTQMVTNIVENALTHGADGGTQVHISGGVSGTGPVTCRSTLLVPAVRAAHRGGQDARAPGLEPGQTNDARDGPGVWLRVADDGPGVAAEHLPHLCERFYRVDSARTRRNEPDDESGAADARPVGSGLGLAITRCIIQAHRGELRVQSECGRGTVFEVWLPAARSQDR